MTPWCVPSPWVSLLLWAHSGNIGAVASECKCCGVTYCINYWLSNPCLRICFWRTKTKTKTDETAIPHTVIEWTLPYFRYYMKQFSRIISLDPSNRIKRLFSHNRWKLLLFLCRLDLISSYFVIFIYCLSTRLSNSKAGVMSVDVS